MTGKESRGEARESDRTPRPKWPAIEIEDHTDEQTQEELAEVLAMVHWVKAQRAAGNLPN
jgi:hypothetical protein